MASLEQVLRFLDQEGSSPPLAWDPNGQLDREYVTWERDTAQKLPSKQKVEEWLGKTSIKLPAAYAYMHTWLKAK